MKKCNGPCGQTKEDSEFYPKRYKNGTVGLRSKCKVCGTGSRNKWRAENYDKDNERNKQYNKENARVIKDKKLTKYWPSSTPEQARQHFDALFAQQQGVCAICKQPETRMDPSTGKRWDLAVEHCHSTGTVRGLVCNKHNRAMGLLSDCPKMAGKVVEYLTKKKGA